MAFLLGNWKIFAVIAAVLAVWGVGVKFGYIWRSEKAAIEIEDQRKADTKSCNDDKALTTEASRAYQINLSNLNHELARVKLLYASAPTKCTSVYTAGHSSPPTETELPNAHVGDVTGITTEALIDYAGVAEHTRLQLIGCQGFITKVWEAHK